ARESRGLAQSFAQRERRGCSKVHRAHLRPYWNAQPCIAGLSYTRGHSCAFLAEEQDIVSHEAKIVSRVTALGGEQHQSPQTDSSFEGVEARMPGNGDVIDIIHGGPAYSPIIPLEARGLDNIHRRP